MKRTGRWRKRAKWAGVAACAVILAAWGVSEFWRVRVWLGDAALVVSADGCVRVAEILAPARPGSIATVAPMGEANRSFGLEWPCFDRSTGLTLFVVPYWLLLLVAVIPSGLLFHRDRRKIRPGHCNQCGYDLRTITGGRCPECGMAAAAEGAS